MIKETRYKPKCYVERTPYCDDCDTPLNRDSLVLTTNPIQLVYKCPKCNREYCYTENEVGGYWEWQNLT